LRLHLGRLAGRGVKTVFLEVDENNEPAIRLYRRLGFYEVGRRTGYYPDGPSGPSNALTLRRDLA
jgi:ribosomal-protein-alanine N-acetyltransferase